MSLGGIPALPLLENVQGTNKYHRNAVDFGLPLLNNARCAQLFVEALTLKIPQGGLKKYVEGRIPSEVKSWREFTGVRA